VPVTVFPGPSPGTTHIHVRTVLKLNLQQSACSGTHETRLLFIFRREGIRVDRSAINLDTSTGSRSPVKNFGRFSFRGPCRLARKMAVRDTRLTCTPTHVKPYPKASGHFSPTTRAPNFISSESLISAVTSTHNPTTPFPHIESLSHLPYYSPTDGAAIENQSAHSHCTTSTNDRAHRKPHSLCFDRIAQVLSF
jgi:hypothetical protein